MTALARDEPPPRRTPEELDELTLRRAQRGDDGACRALVGRYERPVFALLQRMVGGPPALVEDLAQETFLDVFRALGGFAPLGPARLSTWILTIATRRAIDALRRRPPVLESLESLDARHGVAAAARTDGEAARRRLGARIARALLALPADQRAAFLLREYHELDYAAIARALDVDLGTVKSRLSRARAALREALAEHATEVDDA
jgi:RNA polymerase sigma-70 factor (ECF subfamily)